MTDFKLLGILGPVPWRFVAECNARANEFYKAGRYLCELLMSEIRREGNIAILDPTSYKKIKYHSKTVDIVLPALTILVPWVKKHSLSTLEHLWADKLDFVLQ